MNLTQPLFILSQPYKSFLDLDTKLDYMSTLLSTILRQTQNIALAVPGGQQVPFEQAALLLDMTALVSIIHKFVLGLIVIFST